MFVGGFVCFEVVGSKLLVKLIKKIIVDVVCKWFNIKFEYFILYKLEGEYYWGGKFVSIICGLCIYLILIKELKGFE